MLLSVDLLTVAGALLPASISPAFFFSNSEPLTGLLASVLAADLLASVLAAGLLASVLASDLLPSTLAAGAVPLTDCDGVSRLILASTGSWLRVPLTTASRVLRESSTPSVLNSGRE